VTKPRGAVGGSLNLAVANTVVRARRDVAGRGPTRARAFFHDNVIVVLMEDALTDAERSLVAGGRDEAVLSFRSELQETMRRDLAGEIEALTERRVRAVMSGSHIGPELAVVIFVLDRPLASGTAQSSASRGPATRRPKPWSPMTESDG
jgi:uncharacterized protein YbcI